MTTTTTYDPIKLDESCAKLGWLANADPHRASDPQHAADLMDELRKIQQAAMEMELAGMGRTMHGAAYSDEYLAVVSDAVHVLEMLEKLYV